MAPFTKVDYSTFRELTLGIITKGILASRFSGISILNSKGQILYGTNNFAENIKFDKFKQGDKLIANYKFANHFAPGTYTITIGVCGEKGITDQEYYDWIDSALEFEVIKGSEPNYIYGLFYIPTKIQLKKL